MPKTLDHIVRPFGGLAQAVPDRGGRNAVAVDPLSLVNDLLGGIDSVLRIAIHSPAYERVDDYSNERCGLGLFAGSVNSEGSG